MRSLADEVPFDIPDSWEWVRLGSIGETNIGLTYKPSDVTSDGVPVLRSNNIQNGQMDYSELLYVSCTVPERAYAHKGNILICARNGSRALVGKSAIVDADGMAFGAFMAIYRSPCNHYIQLFINSYLFRGQLEGATTTTINQVTQEMLKRQLCPLSPIQEQLRIVQKYTELQPLVAAYSNAYDKAQILSKAFPEALKKSILQEAVQGKLVPQDPSDEPAAALLGRIRSEKQRLIKEGKIKKDKHESVIFRRDNSHYEKLDGVERCIDDELPFEIPDSWEWVRLGTVFQHNTGKALNASNRDGEKLTYITTSNLYWDRFVLENLKTMPFTDSEVDKCTVQQGDLLVCEGGDIGRAAIWESDEPMRIQNHIHRLRAYVPVCTRFFYHLFYLYKGAGWIGGKGIAIQGISSNAIHNLLFPLPPLHEQERIVNAIDTALSVVQKL